LSATLTAGDGGWRIAGTLDFDSVPSLFARTDELLAGEAVAVDLSGVESANSAGVALLLEWQRLAHERGIRLQLDGIPEAVRRVARLSQVEPLLERADASL